MKTRTLLIGSVLVAVIGLVMAPGLSLAQSPSPDGVELKRVEPLKQVHSRGGSEDFAKSRADADAKAKAHQDVDQKNKQDTDVKNKLTQQTTASGVGTVDVKNKSSNINYNSLKTGDTVNFNANQNKQIQSFGIPLLTPVR